MQKGQQYTVFQLLQAAVIAVVLLGIAYGIVTTIQEQTPGSDVLSVSCELLGSAYAAAGTGEFFVRTAKLNAQFFDSDALNTCAGLPEDTRTRIYCNSAFCVLDGEPVTETGFCNYEVGRKDACDEIEVLAGAEISVCIACLATDPIECGVFLDEDNCGIYMR